MAKRAQRRPRKPSSVSVVEDVIEYEDGGIYWREKKVGEKRYRITYPEFVAKLERADDHAGQLSSELDRVAEQAARIVRPHSQKWNHATDPIPAGRVGTSLDLGDGQKPYSLPLRDAMPDEVSEAIEALRLVRDLRALMQRGGDCYSFIEAYRLGRLVERLRIRPFEHAAKIGRRKSRKSQEIARRTNEKRAAKRPDYNSAVKSLMATGIRYTPTCQQVANDFGVTMETVRNNTPELRPRRPTRK